MKVFSIVALALLALSSHADDRHNTDPVRDNVDSEGGSNPPVVVAPVTLPPIHTFAPATPTPVPTNSPVSESPVTDAPSDTDAPVTVAPTPSPVTPMPVPVPVTPAPASDPPSSEPVGTGCSVADGIYGEQVGTPEFIDYKYEVVVKEGSTASKEDIIEAIEVAIADKSLSLLFTGCASRRELQLRRRLAAIGVNTNPSDVELAGVACQTALSDCCVVDGGFTVISDDGDIGVTNIMTTIETAAADGEFNEAHEDIVSIAFIDLNPDGSEGSPTPAPGPAARTSVGYGIYIGVAAGALVVIGAAILYKRARTQSPVDADSTIMTPPLNETVDGNERGSDNAGPVYDLNPITAS